MGDDRDELLRLLRDIQQRIDEAQRLVVEFSAEDYKRNRVAEKLRELRFTAKGVEVLLEAAGDKSQSE